MIPNKGKFIAADSSYYICFLEDIQRPDVLILMLNKFEFAVGDKVKAEVSKCEHYNLIKDNEHLNPIPNLNFSEVLRPFFSKFETIKGEGEIIALAAILYGLQRLDKLILDEDGPRLFVENNLTHLKAFMVGTVGFVGFCNYDAHILGKDCALQILDEIETSKFRVTKQVLSEVRCLIV